MEFRVLGPVEVWCGDRVLPLGGPRYRRLLAALILSANRVVSQDQLTAMLWGDAAPADAAAAIQVRVSGLRRALAAGGGPDPVETVDHGYRLHLDPAELDAGRFQAGAESGRRALSGSYVEAAVDTLGSALDLWRGVPYADLLDAPGVEAEVARLEAVRAQAIDDLLQARLELGEHGTVVAELTALLLQTPWDEHRWALLMLAHYRAGRQGDALAAFAAARDRLDVDLGIEPGAELRDLQLAILNQDPRLAGARIDAGPTAPDALPADRLPIRLSSFVGRETELADVGSLVLDHRLVTLTGPGGVGKTALAIELASRLGDQFPGGIRFVELASITDPDAAVAAVTGSGAAAPVPDRGARSLLVVDNCEHLVEVMAATAARLLARDGRLTVLATSRERLGVHGERVRLLAGLTWPTADVDHDPSAVGTFEATRLLLDRAVAVRADVRLDLRTAPALARICRLLDGLPLAIELAAGAIGALDIEQLAGRLDRLIELLNTNARGEARHGSLRQLVDWSYQRLAPAERVTFEQLAVFTGSFDLRAAEAVCRVPGPAGPSVQSVAGSLWRLVEVSLLTCESVDAGRRRYLLLEVVRDHARSRLAERGEVDAARQRHADYFLAQAESASTVGSDSPFEIGRELANLREAMDWFGAVGQFDHVGRIAAAIYAYWDSDGHYEEGRRWLARALALPAGIAPGSRARVLMGQATSAVMAGELRTADAICREVIAFSRVHDDHETLAHALQFRGLAAIFAEELDDAEALVAESFQIASAAQLHWLTGWALEFQSAIALARARYDEAVRLAQRSREVSADQGDPECVGWALVTIATAHLQQGDAELAVSPLRESLVSLRQVGGSWGLSLAIFNCALLAARSGDAKAAAQFLGASERLRLAARAGLLPTIAASFEQCRRRAAEELGAEDFDHAWAVGQDEAAESTMHRARTLLAVPDGPEGDGKDSGRGPA